MTKPIIRPAVHNDVEAMAALKGIYVRDLYRGFLSASLLKKTEGSYYVPEMQLWLEQQAFHVDVLEQEGRIRAFIIYGADPEDAGYGLIQDAACDMACDGQEKRTIVEHSLQQLAAEGMSNVRLWILRDNFRVRFLYESLGFRADGARKTRVVADQEMQVTRYCYQVQA